jgi:hypothetical protein
MRQEAYRSEFSQYASVSPTVATFWPATVGRDPRDFMTSVPAEWLQLGVRPTGPVFFQYMTVAGTPPAVPNIPGAVPVDLGYSTQATPDMWWVAQARGDLDGDGVQSLYETASFTNRVFTQNETE